MKVKSRIVWGTVLGVVAAWWLALYFDVLGSATRWNGAPYRTLRQMVERNAALWYVSLVAVWILPGLGRRETLPGWLQRVAGFLLATWFLLPEAWQIGTIGLSIVLFAASLMLEARARRTPGVPSQPQSP
jgi:hypothetical protein